jgi:prepilin-type N-terminal cleavage/methylation domain-containing protein
MRKYRNRAGFTFIEMILALGIVLFLAYTLLNFNFNRPVLDEETKKAVAEQGIDTANYKTTIDSTRSKIQDIQKQRIDGLNGIKE